MAARPSVFACSVMLVAAISCMAWEVTAQQSDDQLLLNYLIQTSVDQEQVALASYRKRDAQAAVVQFSELIRTYRRMLEIKSLAEQGASHANHGLMVAYGRLANAYEWLSESENKSKALQRAIQHSKPALSKPLASELEVQKFISELDRKL